MDKQQEKAFDFTVDATKLLIALATGFVGFTVTFADALGGFMLDRPLGWLLLVGSWLLFVVSIGCGLWTLFGVLTVLEPKGHGPPTSQAPAAELPDGVDPGDESGSDHRTAAPPDPPYATIRSAKVKKPFALQILSFGLASVLACGFGAWRLSAGEVTTDPPATSQGVSNVPAADSIDS